jgi:MoaA/NifB/PqqE/SkfB family radical SAM enzyme
VCGCRPDELHHLGANLQDPESYDYGKNGLAQVLRNFHRHLWKTSPGRWKKRQVIPCLAGRTSMVVMGNGEVSSCEMLPPVADLRRQSWREIRSSPGFQRQLGDIAAGKCHCTHNCAMFDSILFSPKQLARLAWQPIE